MKHKDSEQSLSLIKDVLVAKWFNKNQPLLIQTHLFKCGKGSGFDSKGSARIELFCGTEFVEETSEMFVIHGVAENIDEQRVSMTLFCEIRWYDNDFAYRQSIDEGASDLASLVMDFAREQQYLSSGVFVLSLKSRESGHDVGQGSGYLLFENNSIQ